MMHLYALQSSVIRACKSAVIFLTSLLFTANIFAQPVVRSFTPTSASQGSAVTIKGLHFTGATSVRFGTVAAASYVVTTDSTITAVTGAGASGYVHVTTPAGTDSLAGFTYILASPPPAYPTIRYYYPSSAGMGDTVTIIGNHLLGLQAVEFGNVVAARFSVISDTLLYATVGTGASGYVLVRSFVADSLPGFTFTTAVPPPAPVLHSFFPDSARTGDTVRITGIHFTGARSVLFGGVTARSYSIISDSLIMATVGTGASGYVTVRGSGSDSLAGFRFIPAPPPAAPVLHSFFPDSARTGDTVRITGAHLTGLQSVQFGGTAAHSFDILSDSLVIAMVGTGSSGRVRITGPGGSDSLAGFIFIQSSPPPPVLHSFFPDSARTGSAVRITGIHFTGTRSVLFGGVTARSYVVISDSLIIAIVGTGATGYVVVNGSGSDSLPGFRFIPSPPPFAPVLHSFFPDSAGTGDTVRITGIHFTGALAVTFGGVTARSYAVISDSLVIAIVGNGATGYVTVRGNGSDSLGGFRFITSPPVTPPAPPVAGFQLLQFSGSSSANQPVLVWKARNENSIAYYIVEQSIDSNSFTAVTSITPKIQDTGVKTYVFTDPAPRTGVNYYRLNIKDTTGHSTYSGIVTVQLMGTPPVLSFYPNPASNGSITVAVPATTAPSKFQLVDMSGNIIQTIPVQQGVPQVKISIGNGMKGLYKLVWSDGVNYSYQTVLMMR